MQRASFSCGPPSRIYTTRVVVSQFQEISLAVPGATDADQLAPAIGGAAVPDRRPDVVRVIHPGTAAMDHRFPRRGTLGVVVRAVRIIFVGIPVRAPLPDVPRSVVQAVRIRRI